MEKKHIISLGGQLASGKSTISKILQEELNFGIYKNGDYFRKLAVEMGMDVTTFNKYVIDHPEIDRKIEYSAKEYAKNHDNFIIDARLGFYAVPESFKVYLKVNIDEAAKRAFYDENRKRSENFATIEEQKEDMIKRYNLENERYFKLYGVRKEDESNYDLIVDTTFITQKEAANIIKEEYLRWIKKDKEQIID